MIDLAGRHTRDLQACADGFPRESRPVLYAPETLLLDGRHQLAVTQQDGGHVAVVGVDPKDDHLTPSVKLCGRTRARASGTHCLGARTLRAPWIAKPQARWEAYALS